MMSLLVYIIWRLNHNVSLFFPLSLPFSSLSPSPLSPLPLPLPFPSLSPSPPSPLSFPFPFPSHSRSSFYN